MSLHSFKDNDDDSSHHPITKNVRIKHLFSLPKMSLTNNTLTLE